MISSTEEQIDSGVYDEVPKNEEERLVEVFPYGITVGAEGSRPVLIFKDEEKRESLPVWVHPVDAGLVALNTEGSALPFSSHHVTSKLFDFMKLKMTSCIFVELVGHHQYVDLLFSGAKKVKLRMRADSVMSLCLYLKARFFCTKKFIGACREVSVEMEGVEKGLKIDAGILEKDHPYWN